ncbi:MAG TPA: CmcI family methyltransferase [Allosphingosinicella sp.]|nr:CmcI family methyltransferase [Allosphingosinicella sp.]
MIIVDREAGTISVDGRTMSLDTQEGFLALADLWFHGAMRVKLAYSLTWLGRPVIQFADDLMRLQELVYRVQPDVILETGIAHGGSLIFHAGLCKLLDRGRVIGIDIDIREHNRSAIEGHKLAPWISLFEGSSIDPAVVRAVKATIEPGETVLLVLDSNHSKAHVLAELEAWSDLVGVGSYIAVLDGYAMEVAAGAPQAAPDWATNNPNAAVVEFVARRPEFRSVAGPLLFNESLLTEHVTGFRGGLIERIP